MFTSCKQEDIQWQWSYEQLTAPRGMWPVLSFLRGPDCTVIQLYQNTHTPKMLAGFPLSLAVTFSLDHKSMSEEWWHTQIGFSFNSYSWVLLMDLLM